MLVTSGHRLVDMVLSVGNDAGYPLLSTLLEITERRTQADDGGEA
jgi:hypothetical protein